MFLQQHHAPLGHLHTRREEHKVHPSLVWLAIVFRKSEEYKEPPRPLRMEMAIIRQKSLNKTRMQIKTIYFKQKTIKLIAVVDKHCNNV